MNNKSVLIIDDSTTIRRLCDSQLSGAGYHVLMAANAEDGVAMARSKMPDLIILDHQLPGTTGYDVACQLLSFEETAKIPVVASSTLRKKAYAEYLDCDNVVDMLPKPYTPEALIATVESAINTAATGRPVAMRWLVRAGSNQRDGRVRSGRRIRLFRNP